jgi:histone acetyltransferase 1
MIRNGRWKDGLFILCEYNYAMLVAPRPWIVGTDGLSRYEKVAPPTPSASQYSIVGYATTYRWWLYPKKDPSETPTAKDGPFPCPDDIRFSELPSRLRIAQFLILPPHQGSGHGIHLYTAIHSASVKDSTVVELTVEDPNEAFDALRDTADYHILRPEFLKQNVNINPNPYSSGSTKRRPRLMPTSALIPIKALHDIRCLYKIAPTQFAHILEMFLLSRIPFKNRAIGGANMARLVIKKHKAEDENDRRYYWWRMLVKQRLYKRSRDMLIQLDLSDRIQKLDETLTNVEEGYEALLKAFVAREENNTIKDQGGEEERVDPKKTSMSQRTANGVRNKDRLKRKLTVVEDDSDEDMDLESEVNKRPKV